MDLVSVVIPTYNNEKTLERCLESIRNQTHKDVECIVVDRFSSDRTVDIAKGYSARVISDNGERTRAKNIGIGMAKGKYICFIDSDMELGSSVLQECIAKVKDRIGGVIIPERSIGKSFWVKVRDFERSFYAGSEIESARFFRRDLAEKAGGFDEDIIFFEESVLPQRIERLGFGVRERIGSGILHNEDDFNLWSWLKKKQHYGKTIRRSRQSSIVYRLGLFLKDKRFYSRPVLAAGVLILKSLEFVFTIFGKVKTRL